MRILCTMPGRLGDIFWSLAAVRAVAEQYGEKVDFATSPKYAAALAIVETQDYIGRAFAVPGWEVQETAPMTPSRPPVAPEGYDHTLHLGYTRWPELPLAFEAAERHAIPLTREDLGRAWIRLPPDADYPADVVVGFTDEWAELKAGIIYAVGNTVAERPGQVLVLAPRDGSRLSREWNFGGDPYEHPDLACCDLLVAANYIRDGRVFLGCLSSLAVLAAAMGKPRVLVEPNPQRHHRIFQHPDQPLVMGNDGKPTWDARHVVDALREKLKVVASGRSAAGGGEL